MKKAPHSRRKPVVEEIEPRILYSADFSPGLLAAAPLSLDAEQRTLDAGGEFAAHNTQSSPQQQVSRHEVVFVDTGTPDYQTLIEDIKAQSGAQRQLDVVLLDPKADGIKQISTTLAGMQDVSAVHIIGHGADGEIALGGATLNFDSLVKNAAQIKGWGQALVADADLLIYGCDVAQHADGKALVYALGRLTGADVAASIDLTGNASLGGDWTLEYNTGHIDTTLAISVQGQLDYSNVLQGTAAGTEVRANTTTTGAQSTDVNPERAVAMDAQGNYVVVWSGNGAADPTGIYGQRFNASGVAQGGEFSVNTTTVTTQSQPSVAMDASGNFVVSWTTASGSGNGVHAQRFTAAGVAQGSEMLVNTFTTGDQNSSSIAMNASGAFVVAWTSDAQDNGTTRGVYAQRYDATGAVQGLEFRVNVTTANDQDLDSVAMDASGNFLITWASDGQDGSANGIYSRRFDSAGTALDAADVRVNTLTTGDQFYSSSAMDANGDYVVTWTSMNQEGGGTLGGIYGQRYNSAGVKQGGEFHVNSTTADDQQYSNVAMDSSGNFVVTWSSFNQDAAGSWGVYKQEYYADGTTNGGEVRVNTTTSGDQLNSSAAMNASGAFAIVWSGNGSQPGQIDTTASGGGVFLQRYAAALVVDTAADPTIGMGDTSSISALLANKGSDGKISLREAILAANNTANVGGADVIKFHIAGSGSQLITLASALPNITDAVVIDGTSQPGYAGTPLIELDGQLAGGGVSGLTLTGAGSSGSTIKGLAVNSFSARGIQIVSGSTNNVISGDYLGTNAAGTVAKANLVGLWVATDGNTIGGLTAADRNVISGNTVDGIQMVGATNTIVEGNYIGLNAAGTSALANQNQGVAMFGSSTNNTIGGTVAGAGNLIAGNTGSGLRIDDAGSTGNAILGNAIYGNTNLGIDLNSDGLTANDAGDGDGGANRSQNYPVLASAVTTGAQVTITGTLNSTAGRTFRVEFFASATADPSLHGEAERYLGFVDVTTPGSGNIAINTTLLSTVVAAGEAVTATATDLTTNETSEFALNVLASNINTAPALDASKTPVLNAINEDAGVPSGAVGTLISSLVDFAVPAGQVDNVTDVDGAAQLGIAVTAADTVSGNWFYSINGGGTWNALGAVADNNARLLAADANTRIYFQPAADFNGTLASAITFRAWDRTSGSNGTLASTASNGGTTAFSSLTDTAAITVNAVNDVPVNTMPAAQSVNEDTALVFSSGNGNLIAIGDVDAGINPVQVTLTAANGLVTLNGVAGLSFSAGDGTSDGTMTFTGTLAQINTALNGLSFNPTANYSGAASLQIVTNDQGNTGSGGAQSDTDTVNITVNAVNDAPLNTVPAPQATAENTNLVFSTGNGNRISVADVDAGTLQVSLTAANGTLSLSGVAGLAFTTGDGSADASMVFTGTIAAINTALDGLLLAPAAGFTGAASVQIGTSDLGATGSGGVQTDTDTVNVTVTGVNDAPVNTVSVAQSVNEDTGLVFSTGNGNLISISDVDAGVNPVQVTLTATNGAITLNGVAGLGFTTGDGTADATMTFTGTLAQINAALDGLSFNPTANYFGAASLQIVTNDQGNTGSGGAQSDTDTVNITISALNDAPVNTVPAAQGVNEDTALVFSIGNGNLISVADVDLGAGTLQVSLSVTGGALTLNGTAGLAFTAGDGTADGTMTFTGSAGAINTALNGLSFAPGADFSGGVLLSIATSDQGNTGVGGTQSDNDTVAITVNAVNDGPVNTVPGVQAVSEDTALVFSTGNGNLISIADADAGASALRITLTAANGLITLSGTAGLGFSVGDGAADASMTFAGTLAQINAALDGLSFAPGADFSGAAALTLVTDDQGNTGAGGPQSDSDTITINVAAVNDAPVATAESYAVAEDGVLAQGAAGGVLTNDADVDGPALNAVLVSGPSNGSLSFNADGSFTYTPGAEFNGVDSFVYQASDGTASSASTTVTINVAAVNDAPVLGNDTLTIMQGGAVVLSGANLSAADIDSAAGALLFTVSNVADGQFELVAAPGVAVTTFTQGAVAAGQVRFVHDGSSTAPGFDLMVSDGVLTAGPSAASIVFSVPAAAVAGAGPVVIVAPPPPPPAPVFTNPAAEPAAPAEPTTESSPAAAAGEPQVVFSPGRLVVAESVGVEVPAPQHGLARFVRLEPSSARTGANPAPSIQVAEMTLLIQGSEPTYMEFGPSTLPNWSAHSAFPDEGHGSERDQIKVIMESVEMGGLALSVGVVWWASRVGGLIGSLLASMPAWRHLDPLPIMSREEDEEEGDQLQDADADADELAVAMVLEGSQPQRAGL